MIKVPDVVGLELENGLQILKQFQCEYSIVETLSPKASEKNGECRIIHLRKTNDAFELIVSFF